MIASALLAACVLAASEPAPVEVRIERPESVSHIAQRLLGDARAASELKAINQLSGNTVRAGTMLKLPGPERGKALAALAAAQHAVEQSKSPPNARKSARAKLKEAEALLASAQYKDAAKTADDAWKLVSGQSKEPARFQVDVAASGHTQVRTHSGPPVKVEAQGVEQPVYAGQALEVAPGEAPPAAALELPAPTPLSPGANEKLKHAIEGQVQRVRLSWQPVPGAKGYEVEVSAAGGAAPVTLKVAQAKAELPELAPGRYEWSVRAVVTPLNRSPASPSRSFELVEQPMKLEVGNTKWK